MSHPLPALCLVLLAGCQSTIDPSRETPVAETGRRVLIVTDESDRMEPLAGFLRQNGEIESTIIDFTKLPEEERRLPHDISDYDAVIGYIHGELNEPTELAIINYTAGGGRFVAVHHMVSTGKSRNAHYFDFLGLRMEAIGQAREPARPEGHYMWREPVAKTVVNLAPDHYITSHDISWPQRVTFKPTDLPGAAEQVYPAIAMSRTEVYSNVKRTDGDAKTLLLGYIYTDDRNGVTHAQATDGWIKASGEGQVIYIQPGHFVEEFSDPDNILDQLILNAVNWHSEK